MSIDGIAALLFVVLIGFFLWRQRKKVELQKALFPVLYVVMYRSKFGVASMNSIAKKFPRLLRVLGDIGIVLGFLGMVAICAQLIHNTVQLFTVESAVAGIQPVLPIQAKGVFFVPFLYWIISIFLLALVHEFSHGVLARAWNIPVKSSGFAFLCLVLPIIPAAFVEPDEKVVRKRSNRQQWAMLAAGPFSNLIFAALIFGAFTLFVPVLSSAFNTTGVEIVGLSEGGPAAASGLLEGDVITSLNSQPLSSVKNMSVVLEKMSPGDILFVETAGKTVTVPLGRSPSNESVAFFGIQAKPHTVPKPEFVAKYGRFTPLLLQWFGGLLFWLFMLNVGIGLFNLLPIGPLDGGRMFQLVCLKFFKKETAIQIWKWVSIFFVAVILLNMFSGFFT